MTWRQTAWAGNQRWLFIGMTILFAGICMVVWTDDSASTFDRVVTTVTIGGAWILLAVMHSWLTMTSGQIRLGFFPFYWVTLHSHEIKSVSLFTFRPFKDFGGTGVKGSARSKNGILLGGVPSTGLRFETFDNRRYVITLKDLEPAIQVLEAQGFTLSAESSTSV